jgi:hypothetical protein
MADKEVVTKEILEHRGIFNLSDLYTYAHNWLRDENYGVTEDKYNEKILGNGSKDIDIEWTTWKKWSDYIAIELKIKFEIRGASEVEVEIDGVKQKAYKGNIRVETKGNLVRDPESKYDTSPWWRTVRDIYNKFIIPAKIDAMQDKVREEVFKFKDNIKAFLDLVGKRTRA